MVKTRGGADSSQPQLDELKGVSVKRKSGGGVKPCQLPQQEVKEPRKRQKAGGRSAGRKSDARQTAGGSADVKISGAEKADHARAVAASVEAGAVDAHHKLQRATKQTGLTAGRATGGGGNISSSGGSGRSSGPSSAERAGGSSAPISQGRNDPQEQLQHETKQTGLKPGAGSGSAGAGTKGSDRSKRQPHGGTQQGPSSKTAPTGSGGSDKGRCDGDRGDAAMLNSTTAQNAGEAERSRSPQADAERQLQLDRSEHKVAPKRDGRRNPEVQAAKEAAAGTDQRVVKINRAPTLTLWVKVVAQREGYDEDAALTFGRAISGMLAQSKGRSLGIFQTKDQDTPRPGTVESENAAVFGMHIKISHAGSTTVAVDSNGKVVSPKQARGYLERAFQGDLAVAEEALSALAKAHSPSEIGSKAYRLYEQFRDSASSLMHRAERTDPQPDAGWGQKGELNLSFIASLAQQQGSI